MTPEQARGEAVDERADVYSLGAVLYEVLAGVTPYGGRSSDEVLKRVIEGAPLPLEQRQVGVPEELLRIVHKAMARDPEERYPTAKELADDLKRFQTAQLVLDPDARTAFRERLAVALEAFGRADPTALAEAKAVDGQAFDRAAQLYRMFLELPRELKAKLGEALSHAGRGAEAAEAYAAASVGADAAESLELQRRSAEQLLRSGRIDEGLAALWGVLSAVGLKLAKTPRRALLSLLLRRAQLRLRGLKFRERPASAISQDELTRIDTCWSAVLALSMVDTLRGAEFQTRHLLLALDAGEPYRIARAVAVEAGLVATAGGTSRNRTEQLVRVAETLSRRIGSAHAVGLATWCAGVAAYLSGNWRRGHHLNSLALEVYRERCRGVVWEVASAQAFSLWSLFYLGQISEISKQVPALLDDARERGDLYHATNLSASHTNMIWLAADDPTGARTVVETAMRNWSPAGFHLQHYYQLYALTQSELYRGDVREALRRVIHDWPKLVRSHLLRIQLVRIESLFLRARAAR